METFNTLKRSFMASEARQAIGSVSSLGGAVSGWAGNAATAAGAPSGSHQEASGSKPPPATFMGSVRGLMKKAKGLEFTPTLAKSATESHGSVGVDEKDGAEPESDHLSARDVSGASNGDAKTPRAATSGSEVVSEDHASSSSDRSPLNGGQPSGSESAGSSGAQSDVSLGSMTSEYGIQVPWAMGDMNFTRNTRMVDQPASFGHGLIGHFMETGNSLSPMVIMLEKAVERIGIDNAVLELNANPDFSGATIVRARRDEDTSPDRWHFIILDKATELMFSKRIYTIVNNKVHDLYEIEYVPGGRVTFPAGHIIMICPTEWVGVWEEKQKQIELAERAQSLLQPFSDPNRGSGRPATPDSPAPDSPTLPLAFPTGPAATVRGPAAPEAPPGPVVSPDPAPPGPAVRSGPTAPPGQAATPGPGIQPEFDSGGLRGAASREDGNTNVMPARCPSFNPRKNRTDKNDDINKLDNDDNETSKPKLRWYQKLFKLKHREVGPEKEQTERTHRKRDAFKRFFSFKKKKPLTCMGPAYYGGPGTKVKRLQLPIKAIQKRSVELFGTAPSEQRLIDYCCSRNERKVIRSRPPASTPLPIDITKELLSQFIEHTARKKLFIPDDKRKPVVDSLIDRNWMVQTYMDSYPDSPGRVHTVPYTGNRLKHRIPDLHEPGRPTVRSEDWTYIMSWDTARKLYLEDKIDRANSFKFRGILRRGIMRGFFQIKTRVFRMDA